MLTFEAATDIAASPAEVWDTLVQTDRWPTWDHQVERVDGTLADGERIEIHITGVSRPFKLSVAEWKPADSLTLRGGMPLGLFRGTRVYRLEPSRSGTRFEMVERYTGPLAPLITRTIPDLQPSFDRFVTGLRDATEAEVEA